jgi:hypothetical protein
MRQLNLAGSRLPGMRASDAQIDGLLWLDDCRFDGPLELVGARIDGALSLRAARFAAADLRADALTVARTLDATGLEVTGEVLLRGARIDGVVTSTAPTWPTPGVWRSTRTGSCSGTACSATISPPTARCVCRTRGSGGSSCSPGRG